jgi:D-alanyl-D-alanine dipeptidase
MYAYFQPKCILTQEAAKQLSAANDELKDKNQKLQVYNCYTPQRTIDFLGRWKESNDTPTQFEFYPNLTKAELFSRGYLSNFSDFSRGSTVAVTIVPLSTTITLPENNTREACYSPRRFKGNSLDMGTNYDCFHELSRSKAPVSETQKQNRQKLEEVMQRHNFKNNPKAWWIYTLNEEPFPETTFDFVVQ